MLDAARVLDAVTNSREESKLTKTFLYTDFVQPFALSGAGEVDQGEQDHVRQSLIASVRPAPRPPSTLPALPCPTPGPDSRARTQTKAVVTELQQCKSAGAAFKNVEILLQKVATSVLKEPLLIYEQSGRDFIVKNLDPVGMFYHAALQQGGGTNLVRLPKTPPRPDGVRTRSITMASTTRLRPRNRAQA